jgi:AcrR family transcriptional regulator
MEPARSSLRGVTPHQQARSEATFQALIAGGREALEDKTFDQMAIGDISRAAGVSVGAFYGRFENKEAFFLAIQDITVSEIEENLRRCLARLRGASDAEFLAAVAKFSIGVFREHRGFYFASAKHSSMAPDLWSPIRRLGFNVSGCVARELMPRLARRGKRATEREIRIGMQFMNGVLVNAVLNDPGPLRLDDGDLEKYLVRYLCAFFGIDQARKTAVPVKRTTKRGKNVE